MTTQGDVTLGSVCTGYGGLDVAVEHVFTVERLAWWSDVAPGAIAVSERHHPDTPNLGNVSTLDWATVEPRCARRGASASSDAPPAATTSR